MSDACFLAESVDVPVGGVLRLDGPEGRHAAVVRRVRVGERVLLTDGRGHGVRGPVTAVNKTGIAVEVAELLTDKPRRHQWTAVQALAKGGADRDALDGMTQVGVDEVLAWPAARSIVRWDVDGVSKRLDAWTATAREAAKQSRRLTVPAVGHATTEQVVERILGAAQAFVLHESATAYLADRDLVAGGEVVFVVGPEGGIADEELAAFTAAGAVPVLVGDHVLRSAIAGLVGLAQLRALARLAERS
jgi:16S rRNA (uracil1498-N3)-methyltransferase